MKNLLLLTFLLFFIFSTDAFSAIRTWDGGGADANWGTPANWVGDVAPVFGDSLVFPATATQFATTNNILPAVLGSLTFEGGNYTIGGNPFFLRNGLIVNGGTQAINTLVFLDNSQTFTAAQNSTVTILILDNDSGPSSNPFTLTLDGAGSYGIAQITGIGNLIKNGLGAALVASGSINTGAITLNDGVLVVDANIPNSPVTINGGTIGGGDFGFSGFGGTGTVGTTNVTAGVISAGTLTSPTGILNINGNLNFTANGNYVSKIAGTTAGANGHDQLNVTGTVSLNNARLVPVPFGTFRPAIGDSFTILRNDGTDAIAGIFLNAPENAVLAGALNTAFRITYQGGDGNDVVITRVNRANFDYDGDGRSDVSVFRPSNGVWYLQQSTAGFTGIAFGTGSDLIAPADYDGDGKTDLAVFRPSNGVWYLQQSAAAGFAGIAFGANGDIPMPADYDGDGRADLAVFRPSNGVWYIQQSTFGFVGIAFGANGDVPVAADYDGDGVTDIAVFRPSNGVWYLNRSLLGFTGVAFGANGDIPVAADYDGDEIADVAVFRPSNGVWYLQQSLAGFTGIAFGADGDLPVPADYAGDARADIAVFRPSNGVWYLQKSTQGFTGIVFGASGDTPTPNAFLP